MQFFPSIVLHWLRCVFLYGHIVNNSNGIALFGPTEANTFFYFAKSDANRILRALFASELAKLILTIVLFVLAFQYSGLNFLGFFIGFSITQVLHIGLQFKFL